MYSIKVYGKKIKSIFVNLDFLSSAPPGSKIKTSKYLAKRFALLVLN